MAIMDQACVNGSTVFFPQAIPRVRELSQGQTVKVPNGWAHTALVFQGPEVIGYCVLKDNQIDSNPGL